MRFSVVVNTYNRGPSLRKTLESLRHQVYEDFEVVVVNGPSGDSTAEVLAAFDGLVRVVECPEVHLSKSRNLGIEAAAGEVVAFIDDDAIPEPHWLADLAAAYADPRVCGAGGLVYDHTGVRYQYQYSVCDRLGSPRFETKPPPAECSRPGADPFVYLQGTNCSFRRDCLVAVGGFDEEIEYYLDETEVCLQMADHGFPLRPLPRAAVHHKYLASHIRNPNRRVLDPFSTVKNACYFALLHGRRTRPLREVLDYLSRYLGAVRDGAERAHAMGEITAPQLDHFLRRADEGVEVGIDRGLHQQRRRRRFPPRPAGEFLRFPTLRPDGRRLTVCFLSQEYPPGEFGGIGRLYHDLATGFAARGHEVHVVTRSPDDDRVDFEEGVWVHRLVPREPRLAELDAIPLGGNLRLIASRYYEVCRIHRSTGVDLVSAPLWLCEGLMCALDGRFPTVLTLHTTMKTIAELDPAWAESLHTRHLTALEGESIAAATHVVANSEAMLRKLREESGGFAARTFVIPHGTRDFAGRYPARRAADGRVRVLFVGRLEERKGVDLLLEAAYGLVAELPEVDFVLVGKDNPNPVSGHSYLRAHQDFTARNPQVAGRVTLTGAVPEEELYQHYADCDVFCLPSRYESFGLVLTEAMMFGKPVVAADAGGIPEVVEHQGNGLLFEAGSAAALARALRELVRSPEMRARFGRRSRELFEQRFSADIMVRDTIAVHRRVVEEFRPAPPADLTGRHDAAVARMAGILRRTSGVGEEVAGRVARELFGPAFETDPPDYTVKLLDCWRLPAREFVQRLYALLLDRPADEKGLEWFAGRVEAGAPRLEVLRAVALSDEARHRGLDTSWLEDFLPPPDPAPAPAPAPQGAAAERPGRLRGALGRARRLLRRVPVLGKALRYLKWTVLLPRTVHQLAVRTADARGETDRRHAELARACAEIAESLQRRLARHERELVRAVARQLLELRDQLAERDREPLPPGELRRLDRPAGQPPLDRAA